MKANLLISVFLAASALPLFADVDPRAVEILEKAASMHGFDAGFKLGSYEIETVYSSFSGGFERPSRWVQKVDLERNLDLGQRFLYAETNRGIIFQRLIKGDKGQFMFNIGSKVSLDLGSYLPGNAVEAASNIMILALRGLLSDVRFEGVREFAGRTLHEISFTYRRGLGVAYFAPDGRYAGRQEIDLRDNKRIHHVVTAYRTVGGLMVPSHFSLYDDDAVLQGYGKMEKLEIDPALEASVFVLKASEGNKQGAFNPFGIAFSPADGADFRGLKIDREPTGVARGSGLMIGDIIVSIDSVDSRSQDYFTLEELFWKKKAFTLLVESSDKKTREVKLSL